MIEVILLERIDRLGQMGQVVKVRPGFARNFLLPQKKALRATKANIDLFEKQRATLEAKNAAARSAAEKLGVEMDGLKLVIIRQASETGQLYGSVSARDVAEAAKDTKHEINRAQVQIDAPIKALGLFPVKVRLHPEVTVKVTVNVARSPEEAAVQAEKGAAVIHKLETTEDEAAPVVEAAPAPAEDEAEGAPKKKTKKSAKVEAEEAEEPAPKGKKTKTKKTAAG